MRVSKVRATILGMFVVVLAVGGRSTAQGDERSLTVAEMSRLFGGSGSQGDQAGKCCGFLSTCDANNPSPCSGKGVGACDNTTGWTVYRNDSWMCGYTAPLPDPDHPFSCKGSDNASGWQKCREQFYCVVDVLSQPARCVNMGPTDIPPNLNKLMCSENAACQALPGPHP